jgi:hypothetical protein
LGMHFAVQSLQQNELPHCCPNRTVLVCEWRTRT